MFCGRDIPTVVLIYSDDDLTAGFCRRKAAFQLEKRSADSFFVEFRQFADDRRFTIAKHFGTTTDVIKDWLKKEQ